MADLNSERALGGLIREICVTRGIRLTGFSDDWVFCLEKDGRTTYVFGYDFSINTATAKLICKDKAATSDLLGHHKVAHVEHRIFHGPQLASFVPIEGNWQRMLEYFESCGQDVVCKPNEGTGGQGVSRAQTTSALEAAVSRLFSSTRSICISPYEDITAEYRVALLHGEIQFVYRKRRPTLIGDGANTIRDLLFTRLQMAPNFLNEIKVMQALSEMQLDLESIPRHGETVELNWRHNLGQGAAPEVLNSDETNLQPIFALAIRATQVLGIGVASVDVVATAGGIKVLEINAGIMMESLSRSLPEGRNLAHRFYDRIICTALGLTLDP